MNSIVNYVTNIFYNVARRHRLSANCNQLLKSCAPLEQHHYQHKQIHKCRQMFCTGELNTDVIFSSLIKVDIMKETHGN